MRTRILPVVVVAAMTLAACGSSDDASTDTAVDEVGQATRAESMNEAMDDEAMADDAMTDDGGTSAEAPASQAGGSVSAEPLPTDRREVLAESAGINGFIDTREDRLSTFAMDVDEASFTLARSWLEGGQRPPTSSVRVEEFINAADYDYPAPDEGWGITSDTVVNPWNADTSLVRVGLSTPELDPADRPVATLTFVVDTSGSMSGQPLQTVKETLNVLVEQLEPTDRIGIVTYGDTATIRLQPTPAQEADVIFDVIGDLRTNGSTFAEAGLALGYEVARQNLTPNGVDVVVLVSDGVANVGATGPDEILATIGSGVDAGINLLAFGVGGGTYNDALMEQLSNRGNGSTYYVQDGRDAQRLFVDNLESTLVVAAVDSKVQVDFDPDVVREYRLLGYENRDIADTDFRNDTVDAGEVGAGHQVTAIYEVATTGAAGDLGTVSVRWEHPDTREVREVQARLAPRAASLSGGTGTAVAAAALGEILRGSPYLGSFDLAALSDLADAMDVPADLQAVIDLAVTANPAP